MTRTRVCKVCKEEKHYILHKHYPTLKKYRDENGKPWTGRVCNSCFNKKQRHDNRYMRAEIKRLRAIMNNTEGLINDN